MNKNQNQIGFTLVEILVALTIGIFLAGGAAQIFLSTNQTNRMQENLSRMQENARFAMFFLTNDISRSGYYGGVCGNDDFLREAYNGVSSAGAAYQFGSGDDISGAEGGGNNSDMIRVNHYSSLGIGLPLIAPFPANLGDDLFVDATDAEALGLEDNSIVLVTTCDRGDIFKITNDPIAGAGTLKHLGADGDVPENRSSNLANLYGFGAQPKVYLLSGLAGRGSIAYDVADDGNGVPGLRRDNGTGGGFNQLIANIENMQILYGERVALDNINGDVSYTTIDNVNDVNNVVSVRVSLLVRSPDDFLTADSQVIRYNGANVNTGGNADNRLRKVYTTTLVVRNRLN